MVIDYNDTLLIAVIVALVEVAKAIGVPKKFLPLLSILLGVIGGVVYLFPGDIKAGLLIGIIMGLSSVGLYSGTKNITDYESPLKYNNDKKE